MCVCVCFFEDTKADKGEMEAYLPKCCVQLLLLYTGGESHPKPNPSVPTQPKRIKNVSRNGEAKGSHRQRGSNVGATRASLWISLFCSPNSCLDEADILGAHMGCDGASMLLHRVHALHGRVRLLHTNLHGAHLRGLLPQPLRGQAEAAHQGPQFRHSQV